MRYGYYVLLSLFFCLGFGFLIYQCSSTNHTADESGAETPTTTYADSSDPNQNDIVQSDGKSYEVIIQAGHSSFISMGAVRFFTLENGDVHAIAQDSNDVRAWRFENGDLHFKPTLIRVWTDAKLAMIDLGYQMLGQPLANPDLFLSDTAKNYVAILTKQQTQLYRGGYWGEPVAQAEVSFGEKSEYLTKMFPFKGDQGLRLLETGNTPATAEAMGTDSAELREVCFLKDNSAGSIPPPWSLVDCSIEPDRKMSQSDYLNMEPLMAWNQEQKLLVNGETFDINEAVEDAPVQIGLAPTIWANGEGLIIGAMDMTTYKFEYLIYVREGNEWKRIQTLIPDLPRSIQVVFPAYEGYALTLKDYNNQVHVVMKWQDTWQEITPQIPINLANYAMLRDYKVGDTHLLVNFFSNEGTQVFEFGETSIAYLPDALPQIASEDAPYTWMTQSETRLTGDFHLFDIGNYPGPVRKVEQCFNDQGLIINQIELKGSMNSYVLIQEENQWKPIQEYIPELPDSLMNILPFNNNQAISLQWGISSPEPRKWQLYQYDNGSFHLFTLPGIPPLKKDDYVYVTDAFNGKGVIITISGSYYLYVERNGIWQRVVQFPAGPAVASMIFAISKNVVGVMDMSSSTNQTYYKLENGTLFQVEITDVQHPTYFGQQRHTEAWQSNEAQQSILVDNDNWYSAKAMHQGGDWHEVDSLFIQSPEIQRYYLDGKPQNGIPMPIVWFHRERDAFWDVLPLDTGGLERQTKSELQYVMPHMIVDHSNTMGLGPSGNTVLYKSEGEDIVFSYSMGRVMLIPEIDILVNLLPDGRARVHRMSDPAKWIWMYEDVEKGRIFWDENGYYYHETKAVADLMTFRVGNEIFSFYQVGAYFFRPDLLLNRLGFSDASEFPPFKMNKEDKQQLEKSKELIGNRSITPANVSPPRLTLYRKQIQFDRATQSITYPYKAEGAGISEDSFRISILGFGPVTDDKIITFESCGNHCAQGTITLENLPLAQNYVETTLVNENGLLDSKVLTLQIPQIANSHPDVWLVMIAAGDYQYTTKLKLTQKDIHTLKASLLKLAQDSNYDELHIRTWCDEGNGCDSVAERPDQIDGEVQSFLKDVKPHDLVIVYISGHGALAYGTKEYLFIPTYGSNTVQDALPWSRIKNWMDALPPTRKVMLFDTCHSGGVGGSNHIAEQQRTFQQAAEKEGMYIISASAADQFAFEFDALGNGVFTYVLNKALTNPHEVLTSSTVTFNGIANYVSEEVPRIVSLRMKEQRRGDINSSDSLQQTPFIPYIEDTLDFILLQ